MPTTVNYLYQEFFDRGQTYSTTPGHNGWTFKKTGSGTPTCVNQNGRGAKVTLDATSESQVAVLYQNDVLPWTLAELEWMEVYAKVTGIDSVTTVGFGLFSAQNDVLDSTLYNALFRMQGSVSTSAVVAETDDNTNNNDDVATGTTLSSTYKAFVINLKNLADVRFAVDGIRVATGTTFDMSAAATTQGMQFIAQLQKASGTAVPSLTIGGIRTKLRLTY